MKFMVNDKIMGVIGGMCLGSALSHVFIIHFVDRLILKSLGIRLGLRFAYMDADVTMSMLLLALVLYTTFKVNSRTFAIFTYVGMVIWALPMIMFYISLI